MLASQAMRQYLVWVHDGEEEEEDHVVTKLFEAVDRDQGRGRGRSSARVGKEKKDQKKKRKRSSSSSSRSGSSTSTSKDGCTLEHMHKKSS